jgi:preprotein translocase subunit SecY
MSEVNFGSQSEVAALVARAKGLQQRILFVLFAFIIYRLGTHIPLPGVDATALAAYQNNLQSGFFGFFNMFSGGAFARMALFALNIMPYITASIIIQLLTATSSTLGELKKEGEVGRRKINQYTRYLTVVLALFQGALIMRLIAGSGAVIAGLQPGMDTALFFAQSVLSLTAGSVFALWIAEMITERGVGNGGSLLIFAGIISRIPFYWGKTEELVANDPGRSFALVVLLLIYLVTIGLIIVLQEATRKIFIVSAKRQVGNRIYGGQNTHIPFKINPAGVMPIIFAFAVLAFPATVFAYIQQQHPQGLLLEVVTFYERTFSAGKPAYIAVEFLLIVFFTFFYSSIIPSMQPKEIAENLKKYGSSIPGIKPGRPTAEKLEEILTRTTFIGAFALAAITLIASSATSLTGISTLAGLGATSLLIMVGVALDTVNQIRVHLLARQYEGFLK